MQQEDGNHVSLRFGGQGTPHDDSPSFCLLKGMTEGPGLRQKEPEGGAVRGQRDRKSVV